MSLKGFPTFSFDGHFVQRSGIVLVDCHQRNISEIILKIGHLKVRLFLALAAIIFSITEPFLPILVAVHSRYISVKLF